MDNPAPQHFDPQPIHLRHPWIVFKAAEPPLDTLDRVPAADLWQTAEEGLPRLSGTRSHHGRAYADCFVGEEAVTLVVDRHGLDRVDAWLALHRIAQWGWIEHVTGARPFIDGHFFYRWRGAGGTGDRAGA